MRFAIGDLIFYGETGICRVEEIVEKEFLGEVRPCYKLQPLYQSCTIFTPADNEAVFMRAIISNAVASELIESIPSIVPNPCTATAPRELSERYDKIVKTHDCKEYLRFAVSVHAKKKQLLAQKKKISAIDERYLKKVEDLLFGELAAALEIERFAVKQQVDEQLTK